jgi:DNA-binding NtrC family response regulator
MVNKSCRNVTVVSIGPMDAQESALAELLSESEWALCPGTRWILESCSHLPAALPVLQEGNVSIVLYDKESEHSRWTETLDFLLRLPNAPYVIVTSRLADDRLWSEALNLGAYDVLAKPFDRTELVRTLSLAWLRWEGRRKPALAALKRTIGMPLSAWC